ncbi:hypothetical protein RDI58_027165 [Solanum bulbocastanum]|uniref:Uncharacterized protein n=1 Tax=Solanum bulbocastanum TaxID=147425 RepID=A0AAN8SYA1_SOLBU
MAASSSRGRSSTPFQYRKQSTPFSSSSSSNSFMNGGRLMPRSVSSSTTSFIGSGSGSRSMTPSRNRTDLAYSRAHGNRSPVNYPSAEELLVNEPVDVSRSGESISVTVRFRPMSEREYQKGDESAWYADGDKIVRNEYNPATAYAFDKVFGPDTSTQDVYEVAARPVVKAAMEGINGTVFAYGVTSSGKTHTMHGDHISPGIIPLAIKDVFSIIQDTPGCEFLLRVSYLEIYNEVINDLLDPTGQNLRVREDNQGTYVEGIKEEVVLSPGHALSFIAAGEEHRHIGSNNFNLFSSRSHTIFTLMIESSAHGDEYDGVVFSQLNLIDLAGSESSKTETTGLRRKEGSYINKSLLTLGTVIGKLSEGKSSHVPYRDSKLTRLLQTSLSGHGHVSLICTVTPASSNMEETHNTLKFASRAKRVEIYASRNKIIDEKSLIKKYQREISCLKEELDQLRSGMLVGVNPVELMTLKQQLEEGQVKMQSRLEEEEEAKAALMSRIQRLTKLILVSSKNSIPGYLGDVAGHQRNHSPPEDDMVSEFYPRLNLEDASYFLIFKRLLVDSLVRLYDMLSRIKYLFLCIDLLSLFPLLFHQKMDGSMLIDGENQKDPSADTSDPKHRRSSCKWNDDISQVGNAITESAQEGISMSDQMDLLVEQVKMLAGEIAFSTSTLKRLVEQSVNDPESSQTQIQNLECEIQEKRKQMSMLEQHIVESGKASVANASFVEMQQTLMKLMTQCSEQSFELEIKSADNRILQEQLQNKCLENKELQEKICRLEQQLAAFNAEQVYPSSERCVSDEYIDELRRKIQSQLAEENSGLHVQNQKLSEEASYAKELASAAAVELKNLAAEVTKLSLQNVKLEKELLAAREMSSSRSSNAQAGNVSSRKHGENIRPGRRGRVSGRVSEVSGVIHDDFDTWDLDPEDLKMELLARKQREAVLEAALADKEIVEDEYRKKVEEGKKREASLENDLANMWVLVAQLKKENSARQDLKLAADWQLGGEGNMMHPEINVGDKDLIPDARMQEMKEKEHSYLSNGDANSHVCKVCFESPTAAMLLPCRHFCLCKSCSLACIECPICRTKIVDRIFAFT